MNMNHNMRPSDSLFRLQESLVAMLRSRLNVSLGAMGMIASVTLGKLVFWAIVFVLFLNVFLFGNIALGFYLGHLLGNAFSGFGALALGYMGLLLIVVILRGVIQSRVQGGVARAAVGSIDRVNAQLDGVPALRVVPEYREVTIRSSAKPIEALERRVLESSRRAAQAQTEVLRQVDYLRLNYKRVAADVAEQRLSDRVPAYRFVARLINRSLNRADGRKHREALQSKPSLLSISGNGFMASMLEKASVVLPYAPLLLNVVRPVIAAAAISKSRNWLAKLFGVKKKF